MNYNNIKFNDNDWEDLTPDSGIQKIIISPGDKLSENPKSGYTVEINYTLFLEDGTQIETQNNSSFIIGKAIVIRGWDIGILTMNRNEKAIFKVHPDYAYGENGFKIINIPANTTLYYEIELIQFTYNFTLIQHKLIEPFKPVLTLEEKLKQALQLKTQGVKLFTEGKYNESAFKFKEGLEILYGEGLSNEARELMLSLNLNICNCLNNLGAYAKTIDRSDFSLKLRKDHAKVYYYRAFAFIHLNKLEEAESDYNKLNELIPSTDPGLLNLRKLIDDKTPKDVKENKVFKLKSLLNSGVYIDREKEFIKRKSTSDDDNYDEN